MTKILVTGRGTAGSWQIRGVELGEAIGADVIPKVTGARGYDLVIIVKRPEIGQMEALSRSNPFIVWDIVDAWPQPKGNEWGFGDCLEWAKRAVEEIRPNALVAATEAMADDLRGLDLPVLALPHHARPGVFAHPVREQIKKVGYEGGKHYLGKWEGWLTRECARRGWEFLINPPSLTDLDIVVAVRNCQGYAARNWKSNVKLANAQGAGVPIVLNREAGYLETASGGELWADDFEQMGFAFDLLDDYEGRLARSIIMQTEAPRLLPIAARYREWVLSF